jgi:hypothetical protein
MSGWTSLDTWRESPSWWSSTYRNVGDEPVAYSGCDGRVSLNVVGVRRRQPLNIHGCFGGVGYGGCGISHPPLLPPGTGDHLQILAEGIHLQPTDAEGGVLVTIPSHASPGEWQLVVATRDGSAPARDVTTILVK